MPPVLSVTWQAGVGHGDRVSATRLEPPARLLLPLGVALAIAAGLYAFGTQHVPDYSGTALFGRTATDTLSLKSWLATGLLAFAVLQLGLAMWMYGRLPGTRAAGPQTANVHRAVGIVALLVTLPIAYHRAFAYGVKTDIDARIAVHSLAGCFLYGAVAGEARSSCVPGRCPVGRCRLPEGHIGRARPPWLLVHEPRAVVLQQCTAFRSWDVLAGRIGHLKLGNEDSAHRACLTCSSSLLFCLPGVPAQAREAFAPLHRCAWHRAGASQGGCAPFTLFHPRRYQSGRPDLNRGPHRPERCALPGCATPRGRRSMTN